ncbi:hypothetical protein Tco_0188810 [Tanacetum coccineum]
MSTERRNNLEAANSGDGGDVRSVFRRLTLYAFPSSACECQIPSELDEGINETYAQLCAPTDLSYDYDSENLARLFRSSGTTKITEAFGEKREGHIGIGAQETKSRLGAWSTKPSLGLSGNNPTGLKVSKVNMSQLGNSFSVQKGKRPPNSEVHLRLLSILDETRKYNTNPQSLEATDVNESDEAKEVCFPKVICTSVLYGWYSRSNAGSENTQRQDVADASVREWVALMKKLPFIAGGQDTAVDEEWMEQPFRT